MLLVEARGSVLWLTIDRPEVRNALNAALIGRLTEAFRTLPVETRVVVLTGSGASFCAGGDLGWMKEAAANSREENERDALNLANLFDSIARSSAIVIARVNGAAYGGGCGLIAAADIAISSPEAKFAFSEVRLGLIPATISPFVVPKIGAGNARALFVTGEAFDAQRALRIGLIHEIASEGQLDAAVNVKIDALLQCGPAAASTAKRLTQSPILGLEESAKVLANIRAGAEAKEGVSAFLEKRKASFVVRT